MLYILSKALGAVLSPGVLLLLLTATGVLIAWIPRRRFLGLVIASLGLPLLCAIAFTSVADDVNAVLEDRFAANPELPAQIDGIVVLGGSISATLSAAHGQVTLTGAPGRVFAAAILARQHPEAKIVLSGGNADPVRDEPGEAAVTAKLLESLGVDPERLVVENTSRNTYENAVLSSRLVQPAAGQSWVLITSARHMPRAVGVFRHVGWTVIPWPTDYSTGAEPQWVNVDLLAIHLKELAEGLHEWTGLVIYRLMGWTDSWFPSPQG